MFIDSIFISLFLLWSNPHNFWSSNCSIGPVRVSGSSEASDGELWSLLDIPLPGAWRYCRFGSQMFGNSAKRLHNHRRKVEFYPTNKSVMVVFGSHTPFCAAMKWYEGPWGTLPSWADHFWLVARMSPSKVDELATLGKLPGWSLDLDGLCRGRMLWVSRTGHQGDVTAQHPKWSN